MTHENISVWGINASILFSRTTLKCLSLGCLTCLIMFSKTTQKYLSLGKKCLGLGLCIFQDSKSIMADQSMKEAIENVHYYKLKANTQSGHLKFHCSLTPCPKPSGSWVRHDQFNIHLSLHKLPYQLPSNLPIGKRGNRGTGKPSRIVPEQEKISNVRDMSRFFP